MRAMRSVHVVVGIAAVAISSLAFATQIEPPKPKDRWLRVDVGEITLLSDTREHVIVELAKDLWTMRAAMAKTTRLKVNSSLPTTVLVFDNEEAFRPYVDAIMGRTGTKLTGIFLTNRDGNSIAVDHTNLSESSTVLFHELTHYFIHSTAGQIPVWLSEGLAEYYSTFTRSGDKIQVGSLSPGTYKLSAMNGSSLSGPLRGDTQLAGVQRE